MSVEPIEQSLLQLGREERRRFAEWFFEHEEQLTQAAMALPLAERVSLAQDLWQSIEEGSLCSTPDEDREALAEAQRRDAEMSSGAVAGRTHEEVMETMRRTIECA
ncbi:MAG: addiction module protein [Verrucomicrobia bacterium]|nr:addiction module protein [Verrucomicrobiota bacterium]